MYHVAGTIVSIHTGQHTVLLVATVIFPFSSWGNWGTQVLRGAKGHTYQGMELRYKPRKAAAGNAIVNRLFSLFKHHHWIWGHLYSCEFYYTESKIPTKTFWVWLANTAKNQTSLLRHKTCLMSSLLMFTYFRNIPPNLFFLAEYFLLKSLFPAWSPPHPLQSTGLLPNLHLQTYITAGHVAFTVIVLNSMTFLMFLLSFSQIKYMTLE